MVKIIAAIFILTWIEILPTVAQTVLNAEQKAVLATERTIINAVIKTDTISVAMFLSSNYTYTLPDGKIITRRQYLSDIAQWWRPLSIDHTEQAIQIYNKTAIVTGKALYKWKNKQGEIEQAQEQYTDTYVKRKGKWIRVSSHASCLSGRCT